MLQRIIIFIFIFVNSYAIDYEDYYEESELELGEYPKTTKVWTDY